MRLEGKIAIVTGGASGFGAGIARKFVAEGARVMIADLNAEAVEAMAARARRRRRGRRRRPTTPASQQMASAALGALRPPRHPRQQRRHHPPAAAARGACAEDEFDRVLAVNVKSVYLTARHLVPAMKAQGQGVILNIASTAGRQPAAAPHLVQRHQGLDDHRDQVDGGRAGAVRHPRQRAQPGGRRDAAAEDLHRRGHAGDAGEVPRDDPDRPLLDPAGPRQRRRLPLLATRRR